MSWVYLDGTKVRTSTMGSPAISTIAMTFDGIFVWILLDNDSIDVIGFFGGNDGEKINLDISSAITNTNNIAYGNGKIYVFNNTEFVVIDTRTRTIETLPGSPTLPRIHPILLETNCVPEYGNFKLWFTSSFNDNTTKQKLFYYDLLLGTWSTPVDIFGAQQSTPRKIKWAHDSYIWVTAYNETSVLKFNADTGAYITQVIVNRKPEVLTSNDNREIIVGSFNGMISSVNQTTNVNTNIAGVEVVPDSIYDDGTYIWTNQPTLKRTTKGVYVDNVISMAEIPSVTGEVHSFIFPGYGFSLDEANVTSLTAVKQDGSPQITLTLDVDYTFAVEVGFAEQRVTLIEGAPNIIGDAPYNLTCDYTYTQDLKDWEIVGFSDTTFKQVLLTQPYAHQEWDLDTETIIDIVEPIRTVLLADNAIYFAYNLTDSWDLVETRPYYLDIKATAIIGTGPDIYFGETT